MPLRQHRFSFIGSVINVTVTVKVKIDSRAHGTPDTEPQLGNWNHWVASGHAPNATLIKFNWLFNFEDIKCLYRLSDLNYATHEVRGF